MLHINLSDLTELIFQVSSYSQPFLNVLSHFDPQYRPLSWKGPFNKYLVSSSASECDICSTRVYYEILQDYYLLPINVKIGPSVSATLGGGGAGGGKHIPSSSDDKRTMSPRNLL